MEMELKIAQEASHQAPVTFVRTKLDVAAETLKKPRLTVKEAHKLAHDTILKDTETQLKDCGLEGLRVFIISCRGMLDPEARFGDEEKLKGELPEQDIID